MFKPNELPPIPAGSYEMAINKIWQETGQPDILRWKLEILSDGIFKGRTLDKWSYLKSGIHYFQKDLHGLAISMDHLREAKEAGRSLTESLGKLAIGKKVQVTLTRTPRKDKAGKDYINLEIQKLI